MNRKRALDNLDQTFRTITVPAYIPWNADTSERIHAAALQQLAARNLFTAELLKHPDTPVQKSASKRETGLYGLWLEWREEHPYLEDILQAIWRPAAKLAHARVTAWTATNTKHADLVGKAENARKTLLETRRAVEQTEARARRTGLADDEQQSFEQHQAALRSAEDALHTAREDAACRLEANGRKPTAKLVNADPAVKTATKAVTAAKRPVANLQKQAESRGLPPAEQTRLAADRKTLRKAGAALEKALGKARERRTAPNRPRQPLHLQDRPQPPAAGTSSSTTRT